MASRGFLTPAKALRSLAAALLFGCVFASAGPVPSLVEPPVPVPAGDTGFVGSVNVVFKQVAAGKIFYTLDGTDPSSSHGTEFQPGNNIPISKNTTLKAIHVRSGINSDIVEVEFIRAKLPAPVAHYGGSVNFGTTVTCTLTVANPGASGTSPFIRYTLDGTAPNASSALYGSPITIDKSTVLKAYATEPGYDDGAPIEVDFVQMDPPAIPVATPGSKSFSTKTLGVQLKTITAGAVVHYSFDTTAHLDTAQIPSGDSVVIVGNKPLEVITLRAQAFHTGHPPSAIMTEKYTYLPPVAQPTPSRAPGFFYDTAIVNFTATSGAQIRYTLDGSTPTQNSLDGSGPIILSDSVTLKAMAFKAPQPASSVFSGTYALRLSPPGANHPSGQFKDSVVVSLSSKTPKATILYTLDGSTPTLQSAVYNDTSITIEGDSTVLQAIAVKNKIASLPARYEYVKRIQIVTLSAPIIDPVGQDFLDSMLISLRTGDANAQIRYTTDGSDPTHNSPLYTAPFPIDSSTTVKAQAYPTGGNLQASVIREEHYVLIPSPPKAEPAGPGPFANQVQIALTTLTRNASIYYTLGDQPLALELATLYQPEKPITLTSTTKLQAVTVVGTSANKRISAPLAQVFEIYANNVTDTLAAGGDRSFPGGFTFTNASASPILARVHTADQLGIVGFQDAGLAVLLRPGISGDPLNVVFTKPTGLTHSLYRVVGTKVIFISSDTRANLTQPGEYFVGIDTLPPSLTLISQTPLDGDSNSVIFSVSDNVSGPSCEITGFGIPGGKVTRKPDSTGTLALTFRGGNLKPLWLHAAASDFYNKTQFPENPVAKYYLSQNLGKVNTPDVFALGNKDYPWDLGGFPLSETAPKTWAQIKSDNGDPTLQAMVWQDTGYLPLDESAIVKPGMAFWLGSGKSTSSLALNDLRVGASGADGIYRINLHNGWNIVSNPSLDRLYWPSSRQDPNYGQGQIKGLYEFLSGTREYQQSDSLDPWKGYFVYSYVAKDTLVPLYSDPTQRALAKVSAQASTAAEGVDLVFSFGRPLPLRLGARTSAADGIDNEDEPDLPALNPVFSAWSQRDKHRLISDYVRYNPQAILHWDVVIGGDSKRLVAGEQDIRVLEGRLPAGYEAWALSRRRGLKFRLQEGNSISMANQDQDTLSIYAGPLGKLSALEELQRAQLRVEKFAFKLEPGKQGSLLRLALPWDCRVDAQVWSVSGRMLAEYHSGNISQGYYAVPLQRNGEGAFQGATRIIPSSQFGFLRIHAQGKDVDQSVVQKILW